MAHAALSDLFPLPLTPFESYMLAEDRPRHPMTFVVTVTLRGKVDHAAMDGAVAEALGRHPLLTARLARRGGGARWVLAEDGPPKLHWLDDAEAPLPLPVGERIELRSEAGLRLTAADCGDVTQIACLFHHAACDGIGSLRFLGDLLAYYGLCTASPGQAPSLLPIEPENLHYRGTFDLRISSPGTRWEVLRLLLQEGWKTIVRQARPVEATRGRDGQPSHERPGMPVAVLDADVLTALGERAAQAGATVNDVMLQALFLTILQWNEMRGAPPAKRWLRITAPTSLRGKRDARMPAANMLGYALITRREDQCLQPDLLLSSIAEETSAVRKWALGSLFVDGIRFLDYVPGGLRLATKALRRFSTAVLSNLGDPTRRFRARFPREDERLRVGNVLLERISGAPPIRPGTRVSLALTTYAGESVIAMRYDHRWLSLADAEEFLSLYRRQLERSATPHYEKRG